MADYLRAFDPGGTFFFTLVTADRQRIFAHGRWETLLRECVEREKAMHRFSMQAAVILPDHVHLLMQLPKNDSDFSGRIQAIKADFTARYLDAGGREARRTTSMIRQRIRGVWQKRFWEHTIRDERDFETHAEYIHVNPIKHGYVNCAHAWSASSVHAWIADGRLPSDWYCGCDGSRRQLPRFETIPPGADVD